MQSVSFRFSVLAVLLMTLRLPAAQPTTGEIGLLLGPTVTAPSNSSVFIWWQSSRKSADHTVEYGPTRALGKATRWTPNGNSNGNGTSTSYPFIELTGLAPGTACYYRVVSEKTKSDVFSFHLPKAGAPFRAVLWADNQGGYEVFEKRTVPLITELQPDLLLIAGDLVDMGFVPTHWSRDLYGPGKVLLRSIPWYPVRGNHDGEFPLALAMLPLPDSNRWYARTCAEVRWVILDTNLDYASRSPQVDWLEKEITSDEWRKAKFRVVSFHHPPFNTIQSSPKDDGSKLGREVLVPILEAGGADLVVSGHAHVYERGVRKRPDGKPITYIVCGGGGGTLDDIKTGDWPFIKVTKQRHHVVAADVHVAAMRARVIDAETRQPLDAFEIIGGPLTPPVAP